MLELLWSGFTPPQVHLASHRVCLKQDQLWIMLGPKPSLSFTCSAEDFKSGLCAGGFLCSLHLQESFPSSCPCWARLSSGGPGWAGEGFLPLSCSAEGGECSKGQPNLWGASRQEEFQLCSHSGFHRGWKEQSLGSEGKPFTHCSRGRNERQHSGMFLTLTH